MADITLALWAWPRSLVATLGYTIPSNTQLATKTKFMYFNSYLAPYHTARCPLFIHSMLWPEINVIQNVSKVLNSTYGYLYANR